MNKVRELNDKEKKAIQDRDLYQTDEWYRLVDETFVDWRGEKRELLWEENDWDFIAKEFQILQDGYEIGRVWVYKDEIIDVLVRKDHNFPFDIYPSKSLSGLREEVKKKMIIIAPDKPPILFTLKEDNK